MKARRNTSEPRKLSFPKSFSHPARIVASPLPNPSMSPNMLINPLSSFVEDAIKRLNSIEIPQVTEPLGLNEEEGLSKNAILEIKEYKRRNQECIQKLINISKS
jgi:hypothetical protein